MAMVAVKTIIGVVWLNGMVAETHAVGLVGIPGVFNTKTLIYKNNFRACAFQYRQFY